MANHSNFSGTSRVIITFAAFIVVIAGLKAAASFIVPLLLSAFIAAMFVPLMSYFRRKRVPKSLSLIIILMIIAFVPLAFGGIVASSVKSFSQNIPVYEEKLDGILASLTLFLERIGFDLSTVNVEQIINPGSLMKLTTGILSELGNVLTNGLVIIFTVIFMLLEAASFPNKIKKISEKSEAKPFALDSFSKSVNNYVWMKTIISFITGVIVTLALVLFGVDYPILWGTLAFLLNYIPTIGSFIAAVPAILLTIIQISPVSAIFVALVYIIINTIMGNIVEPKYMGKELGLSTLVVFLSLLFWGWVFGPVGMLLSVPLTMVLKIAFENSEDTKWIAVLLGSENNYE